MEKSKKVETLQQINSLPDDIRAAICAGMALGQIVVNRPDPPEEEPAN